MNQDLSDLTMAENIAKAVKEAGGRSYFVGGYVRDSLMGVENKDIDIEVHGLSAETLMHILEKFGQPLTKGAGFGVMGLKHFDLDIAMPRSEKATGKGHKDFDIMADPFIGPEKAAGRRDFTFNALMQDVLTGEISDFFGGIADIRDRKIRHIDDLHFAEDPLRVFRAAQFAARFDFEIDPETIAISEKMDVSALSPERVMGELEKALLKSTRPSLFFENLKAMHQLHDWFPEIEALSDCPQDFFHHPEGNVWVHTMQVLDAAAIIREEAQYPRNFMFSALCHDLGKPLVTTEKNGRIHAYAHEREGLPVVRKLMDRLTGEHALKKYVLNMTRFHMKPNMKVSLHAKSKSFMKLFDQADCPEDLLLLAKADFLGRCGEKKDTDEITASYLPFEDELKKQLKDYHTLMAQPHLTGKDLIDAGIQPGPAFSEALDFAHKLQLTGLPKEEQLRQTLGYLRSGHANLNH